MMPPSTYQGCWLEKAILFWPMFDYQCLAHLFLEFSDMQADATPYNALEPSDQR